MESDEASIYSGIAENLFLNDPLARGTFFFQLYNRKTAKQILLTLSLPIGSPIPPRLTYQQHICVRSPNFLTSTQGF
jgi:hypothetical protein